MNEALESGRYVCSQQNGSFGRVEEAEPRLTREGSTGEDVVAVGADRGSPECGGQGRGEVGRLRSVLAG